MINWHKYPNPDLNSALAILANLPTRKTGTVKTFFSDVFWGLTTSRPWSVSNSSSSINKPLNMFMPPLAYAFRTAAIKSNFIDVSLGQDLKTPLLFISSQIQEVARELFPSALSHLSMNGESQILSLNWEGGRKGKKKKPEEKDKKFSPHIWQVTVGGKNVSSLGLITKEIWNPYQSISSNYCC